MTERDALSELEAAHGFDAEPEQEAQARKRPKQADILVSLAERADLCHAPDGGGYAIVHVSGHRECWPIRRRGFRRWLTRAYYERERTAPSADAMQTALAVIEARAQFDAPERRVHLRRAEHDGRIFIDMCDPEWRVIEIDREGWRIVPEAPVLFRRQPGMLALPEPERGGDVDMLADHANLSDRDALSLAVAWTLAAMRPCGPYPALVVCGEPGSAKSTLARRLRDLVDPHAAPLRTLPRSEQDLWVAAANSAVIGIDNLSYIQPWLSDGLCRLATGGGFAARELYTDGDEHIIDAMAPVLLTGITDVASRPDLADRSILLRLDPLPDGGREESELRRAWERDRPRILGALLDRMAHGLRHLGEVDRTRLPRMADFAAWTAACEYPDRISTDAYLANRRGAVQSIIDSDRIASAIAEIALPWEGTAGDLLARIEGIVPEAERGKGWPSSPRALSARLRTVGPALRAAGVDIMPPSDRDRPRRYRLRPSPENSPAQPSGPTDRQDPRDSAGSSGDGLRRSDGRPSEKNSNDTNMLSVADGSDGLSHTHSGWQEVDL